MKEAEGVDNLVRNEWTCLFCFLLLILSSSLLKLKKKQTIK